MSNLIGQSIGRYHITEQLGQGGMATVYKAFDTRLECDVAIKFIRKEKLTAENAEKALKRFTIEAKKTAQLSHPNIVAITDYGEHEGSPYLVMRYIPGGTLKEKLGKPMHWTTAAKLLVPIAHALDHAHQQKMIHRDVKPANILLTQNGQPMLSDFGIAKVLEASDETGTLTGTGVGIGTPEYMAPEQGLGRAVDHRADIYSLGVVFYELVTGQKPFKADTPMAVVVKQVNDPLPRPKGFVRDLPDDVEKILFITLAKKPEDRYQSTSAFATVLENLAHGKVTKLIKYAAKRRATQEIVTTQYHDELKLPMWVGAIGSLLAIGVLSMAMWAIPQVMNPPLSSTPPPTQLPTIVAPTPTLGIGSRQISSQDGRTMLYVPAGEFLMGSADSDTTAGDNEKPQRKVYLDAFWIDETEVTNRSYALCVSAGVCQSPNPTDSYTRKNYYTDPQYSNYPVIYVSWHDANNYCQWAGRRLPTEAEWEKAARGIDGRLYPWGNTPPDPALLNSSINVGDTTEVGKYPRGVSVYGVLDMAGNVWEWVADWYDEDYYRNSSSQNPKGPISGRDHIVRGGSWLDVWTLVRSAARVRITVDNRYNNYFGIRCAR